MQIYFVIVYSVGSLGCSQMFDFGREGVLIVGFSLFGFILLQVVKIVRLVSFVRIIQEFVEEVVIIVVYRKIKIVLICKEKEKRENKFIFNINLKYLFYL